VSGAAYESETIDRRKILRLAKPAGFINPVNDSPFAEAYTKDFGTDECWISDKRGRVLSIL